MVIRVDDVKTFWNANPCQSTLSDHAERLRYFEEIRERRYRGREWHVPTIARFDQFRDRDVLEIGCGIGTDGVEFARNGARYVGVDLTPNAIGLARERFALYGLDGRFEVANGEARLPFPDESFDHVYSFGVIHHSPRSEAIVDEIYRVLRPGGSFTLMVYNRTSINYYIEIMFLRKLLRHALRPRFMPRLLARVTGLPEWKLDGHRQVLVEKGRLSKQAWISMNTDGPFCPLAKVYGRREAAELLRSFGQVRQEVWEFNSDHWPVLGKLLPMRVERAIGRLWGWHRVVYGTKPGSRGSRA